MQTDGARRVAQSSWAHIIRQCTNLEELRHIHRHIATENTTVDRYLANLFIQMYGNLGSLDDSLATFDSTQDRNIFSWNILLRAYTQKGHIQECFTLFKSMPCRDIVSWNSMLQAYSQGSCVHETIETFENMPQKDILSWSSLITAFAQNGHPEFSSNVLSKMPMWDLVALNSAIPCYAPEEATYLFHTMCVRDSVSWNSLLQTLSSAGLTAQAEYVYLRMPHHNYITWTSMIAAYAATGQMDSVWFIFEGMQQRSVATWNSLIGSLVRNSLLVEVKDVFDKMPLWNVFSWASVITANAMNGHMQQNIDMFNRMPERNHIVWTSMITACSLNGCYAREVFDKMPCRNSVAWNSMMCVYMQSSCREEAQSLFRDIPERDIVSWNEMIHASGDIQTAQNVFDIMPLWNSRSWGMIIQSYVEHGDMLNAKAMFDRAPREEGTVLGNIMMLGYSKTKSIEQAKELFDNDFEHRDSVTWNALLQIYCSGNDALNTTSCFERMPTRDMVSFVTVMSIYANAHDVYGAKGVFDEIPERDVCIWTSLLNAYALTGRIEDAKMVLKHMSGWDMASWTAMMGAYALSGHLDIAREMFEEIPEPDGFAYTVMVTAYGKKALFEEAINLFNNMSTPGVITYNALLEAYCENGYGSEAFELFLKMDLEGISPNSVTYTSVFNACANAGVELFLQGRMLHSLLIEECLVNDPLLITAVINFYGKCGLVEEAIRVFMELNTESLNCTGLWNALASVFAWNSRPSFTFELMSYMVLEGYIPDENMLLTGLTACNHGGLVCEARDFFITMIGDCYILAGVEHYMCIVDVLGRAGQLKEAQDLIENMPFETEGIAWTTLLGACKTHGDALRGVSAARNLFVEFDVHEVATYKLLASSIHVGLDALV